MTEIFEFSAPVASLADLCRLCGEVDNVCVNVFDEGSEELNLVNKIEIAVRISIAPNDTLPKGICTECHEKLNGYSLFYKLCHDTQERLLEFLSIQSAIHQSDGTQELDSEENYGLSVKDNHNDDQDEIFYDGEAQLGDEDDDVEVHVMVSDDIIQDGALTESQEATKAEDAEKSSVAATLQLEREPLVQPFSMQSQKLRTNKIANEATTSLSRIPKKPNAAALVKNCGLKHRNSDEGHDVNSNCRIRKESDFKLTQESTLTSSDNLHTEHSYSKGSSCALVEDCGSPAAPVFIRRVMPIKTKPHQVCNVEISPTSPPPLVPISSPCKIGKVFSMNVDRAKAESPKVCGRVYITNSDKTAAAEVVATDPQVSSQIDLLSALICDNSDSGLNVLRKGDAESKPSKPKRFKPKNKKFRPSHVTTPYLVLADGRLVKLEDVESEIPFEQIPVPPMILFHTSKAGETPPSVLLTRSSEEAKPTLSSSMHDLCPDLETPSGLLVESYPNGCSLPIFNAPSGPVMGLKNTAVCVQNSDTTLMMNLGAPVNTSVGDTKFVVLRTNNIKKGSKKKKLKDTSGERLKNRVPHCPEIVNYLEFIPGKPRHARCKVCDVSYQNPRQCEYHIRSKHLSHACVFACDICDKKFATNFLRRRHKYVVHDQVSSFMCSICGATFRTKSVLENHEMRHNAPSKPLLCEFCGKGFYQRASYIKHLREIHSEEKNVCNICGESFETINLLNEHLSTHQSGWVCKVCGKKFQRRNGLKIHMWAHGKPNSLTCDKCGKNYSCLTTLQRHRESFCQQPQV